MGFDIQPLLTLDFWFKLTPDPFLESSALLLRVLFWGMLALGIIARFAIAYFRKDKWKQKIAQRVSQVLLSMGVFGLFLFWFSYERFPFLSMRLWYLAWLAGAIVWFIALLLYVFRTVPAERHAQGEQKEKAKYLP
ncbi:hypothetical protein HY624_03935 [Candidatus Uhrbacteria bacterium]|nr:hypothetical protein [Candidatus Uhrbacteria bacterium]